MGDSFVMIGASPKPGWLDGRRALAGASAATESRDAASKAGLFAVGDALAVSAIRVGSAAGAGIHPVLEARRA